LKLCPPRKPIRLDPLLHGGCPSCGAHLITDGLGAGGGPMGFDGTAYADGRQDVTRRYRYHCGSIVWRHTWAHGPATTERHIVCAPTPKEGAHGNV